MRIARLELDRFGPFDAATIDLPAPPEGQRGELVILEGPSGSGKTAVLQAIACAAATDGSALMPPLGDLRERLRAPSGSARLLLAAEGASLWSTVNAEGIAWPADARSSPIATRIEASATAAADGQAPVGWAAFAYGAHLATPVVATAGPAPIDAPPLRGALSFGASAPASAALGALLANAAYEAERASVASRRPTALGEAEPRGSAGIEHRRCIERIEDALSLATGRAIHFAFPFGEHAPRVLVDGEEVPLHLLGEGLRNTLAWLSDLLVRLHRVAWAGSLASPFDQAFWLILDDLDASLHPAAQARLLPSLRRLFPNARLYVATHSPFLVASADEGLAVSLRPAGKGRRVTGAIAARRLEPGQSLEWVVEEVFGAETGFLDPPTRAALEAHRRDISRLRRSKDALRSQEWGALLARRAALLGLNEEVRSAVMMLEAPVRAEIEAHAVAHLAAQGEAGG